MDDFLKSKTRGNLLRAFAGESQAVMRYTMAAQKAQQWNLYGIAATFRFTADQEKEHAEVYWRLLKGQCGDKLCVDAAYPIGDCPDAATMLREAAGNEFEEHNTIYADFGRIAAQEGFAVIAQKFQLIAQVEKTHGDRFTRFADQLEAGRLFSSETPTDWFCLNCGHWHNAKDAPAICPVCGKPQGWFLRADLTPFR